MTGEINAGREYWLVNGQRMSTDEMTCWPGLTEKCLLGKGERGDKEEFILSDCGI